MSPGQKSTGGFWHAASGTSQLAFSYLAGAWSLQGFLTPSALSLFLFLMPSVLVIFKNIQRNFKTSRKNSASQLVVSLLFTLYLSVIY